MEAIISNGEKEICQTRWHSWGSFKVRQESHNPYLARLLDITMNNNAIPGDWKKAIVVTIYKGGDRLVVGNYRPVSLTSLVCKQMEHVLAGYLRQVFV